MTQDEVSQLGFVELHKLAALAAHESSHISQWDKLMVNGVIDGVFRPTLSNTHALMVAAALDMTIIFGDKVVLVSEPAGAQSRSIPYKESDISSRMAALRRAITLLAADSAQYI